MAAGGGMMAGAGSVLELQAIDNERKALGQAYSFNINQAKTKEAEVLRRMRINTNILERQSAKERGSQQTAFAASGVAGGDSPLALLAEQEMFAKREIVEMRRQSMFDAKQAKLERKQLMSQRSSMNKAQDLKQIGTLLNFGGGVMKSSGGMG